MKRLRFRSCYRFHYLRGRSFLRRMSGILDLFDGAWDQAVAACPSIDRHRMAARREARLARFYLRKLA